MFRNNPQTKYLINVRYKDMKNMENEKDEDTITIHLGRKLSELEYEAVLNSIIAFMNIRWPNCQFQIPN